MNITSGQHALLKSWVGEWRLIADLSWPLQDTTVLRIRASEDDLIVKASSTSHHIHREIWAHREHLAHLTGVVPELLWADEEAGILVTRYLPGELVLGGPGERSAVVFRQAGAVLARFMVSLGESTDYMSKHIEKAQALVDRAHGLAPDSHLRRARRELEALRPIPVPLVLTHGDYQPRNWLQNADGQLLLIDFGRAAARHWTSELPRLESRAFDDEDLETAFFEGLGYRPGPDDIDVHHLERVGMALGTIVWAHDIGDFEFESEGRSMLARALGKPSGDGPI